MDDAVNVRAVAVLENLRAFLGEFSDHAREALVAVELESRRALEWLGRRVEKTRRDVEDCEDRLRSAREELADCEADDDDEDGTAPDCAEYEEEVERARADLRDAESQLSDLLAWQARLWESIREFEGPARDLARLTSNGFDDARGLLSRKLGQLGAYLSASAPSRGVASTTERNSEASVARTVTVDRATLITAPVIRRLPMVSAGINRVDLVTLWINGVEVRGVFKPEQGEHWPRATIANRRFSLAKREELAARIDTLLETRLVPETVYRSVDGEHGSVQLFAEGTELEADWTGRNLTPEERYRLVVLDWVLGNTDRNETNLLRRRTDGTPVAIDHGYSFPIGTDTDPMGLAEWWCAPASELTDQLPEQLRHALLNRLNSVDWNAVLREYPMVDAEKSAFWLRVHWMKQHLAADDLPDQFLHYRGRGFFQPQTT